MSDSPCTNYPILEGISEERHEELVTEWIEKNNDRYAKFRAQELIQEFIILRKTVSDSIPLEADESEISHHVAILKAGVIKSFADWCEKWNKNLIPSDYEILCTNNGRNLTIHLDDRIGDMYLGKGTSHDACTGHPLAIKEFHRWVEINTETSK